MSIQGPGAVPAVRKAKEWSPIDRMIASNNKGKRRGSKSPKPAPITELPPLPKVAATPPLEPSPKHGISKQPLVATASVQTTSWEAVMEQAIAPARQRADDLETLVGKLRAQLRLAEEGAKASAQAIAPERQRAYDLEALVRSLRAQLQEEAEASAQALEAKRHALSLEESSSCRIAELEAELRALRKEREQERNRSEEERGALASQLCKAQEETRQGRLKIGSLRDQLTESQNEVDELRERCKGLRENCKALAGERDSLMSRMEQEQAEMMARVEQMERRMSRPSVGGR